LAALLIWFAIEIAAVVFIAMQKSVKKTLRHGLFLGYAKSGNFREARAPLEESFSQGAVCCFKGDVSCFETYHATFKTVILRYKEYSYYISITIFITFILLMLSKKRK
jgi:hypothetical protein